MELQAVKLSRQWGPANAYKLELTLLAETAARRAMVHGLRQVEVRVKGPGSGREAAIRSLQAAGPSPFAWMIGSAA